MPVFSGKVLEFPAFWDRFQGCVHSRTDLDDASKFSYLPSSLSGEALAAVRFGRTDAIVREHVKAIWNVKPCTDSGDSIQALVDEINRHLRCLTALGKNPSTGVKGDLPEFLDFAHVRAAAKRAVAASSGGGRLIKQDDPKQQEPGPVASPGPDT
ncbi:Protein STRICTOSIDINE SYNTHASE-LIKE [Trichinella spiralis]|uniref:Protein STRICTOSIDINE SYNTHASE-LIKE n=1 Tax=Trichinella spiralis TaxID=6334 RepID=A0ABR3KGK4_TRISP